MSMYRRNNPAAYSPFKYCGQSSPNPFRTSQSPQFSIGMTNKAPNPAAIFS